MRTRPFLLGLSLGILLGIAAASAVDWWSERNMRPIQRTAEAARAAEYTYLLYLYAPYPVAVGFLDRESSLLQRLAAEASTENERNSFLRDLAASEARLARLHARNDHQDAADRAIAQAVGHLRDSGSTWTESELLTFVDELDKRVGARSATIYQPPIARPEQTE